MFLMWLVVRSQQQKKNRKIKSKNKIRGISMPGTCRSPCQQGVSQPSLPPIAPNPAGRFFKPLVASPRLPRSAPSTQPACFTVEVAQLRTRSEKPESAHVRASRPGLVLREAWSDVAARLTSQDINTGQLDLQEAAVLSGTGRVPSSVPETLSRWLCGTKALNR